MKNTLKSPWEYWRHMCPKLNIHAPSLLEYELLNGLLIAKKRDRVKEEEMSGAIDGFLNLEIPLKSVSLLYPQIMHYCEAYNRSAYDASYMALAEKEGTPFVTADKSLFNAVKGKVSWVKWLGDI